jgi:hypothetical protein
MNVPLGALLNDSFLQGLLLLLATAAITGLLVPVIKGRIDDRKLREQKVFESELARQSKVIEAQARLLEDLSQMLWGFLLLSLEVTYYATRRDEEKFQDAWRVYDASSWDYFGKIRAEISKARRLTSPETHDALLSVYDAWFMGFDLDLTSAARSYKVGDPAWPDLHNRIYGEGVVRIDGALTDLAEELQLTTGDVGVRRLGTAPGVARSV